MVSNLTVLLLLGASLAGRLTRVVGGAAAGGPPGARPCMCGW
ncbi:MAG: hypothetical protein WDN04_05100 [Rhodospirillales bacterium]